MTLRARMLHRAHDLTALAFVAGWLAVRIARDAATDRWLARYAFLAAFVARPAAAPKPLDLFPEEDKP